MRSQLANDLVDAWKPGRQGRTQPGKRPHVTGPHAVAIFVRPLLRGENGRTRKLGEHSDFTKWLLSLRLNGIDRFRHAAREPPGEFKLGLCPDHRLLHDVRPPRGLHHGVIDVEIAIDEDALTRHLDIVEDDERILLVETAGEWVVEFT